MSSFSDYLENELLDAAFNNGSFAGGATLYMALYTAAPTDAGGGTEVSGAGYARQTIAFGAASGGAIANTGAVEWTASGGNYGTVVAIGIFDALTGGNLLAWDEITSVVINDTDTLTFAIGDVDITLD
jgi:hypothetical protein